MNNLNMRRILKKPTLRMDSGGDMQVPTGPGMDRAGFLERNPGAAANYTASPSPGAIVPPPPVAAATPEATPTAPPPGVTPTAAAPAAAPAAAAPPNYWAAKAAEFKAIDAKNVAAVAAAKTQAAADAKAKAERALGMRESIAASARNFGGQQMAVGGISQSGPIIYAEDGMAPTGSLRWMSQRISQAMAPTPEKLAKEKALADYRAQSAAPQPAAPAAAQPQPAAPMGSQSVIDGRMKAAGLREGGSVAIDHGHGGRVPGHGHGDKIPAKYEPGEFVVSNDMLDAKPGLRGELRALRKKVLARKGMTPAQADAKALGKAPGSLRAQAAGSFDAGDFLRKQFPAGAADLDVGGRRQFPVAVPSAQTGVGPVGPAPIDPNLTRLPPDHGYAASSIPAGDMGNTAHVTPGGTVHMPNERPALAGPAAQPIVQPQGPTLRVGANAPLKLGNTPVYKPGPLAADTPSVDQMNAPGVASRAARAQLNAPGSLGGNPVLDAQGEALAMNLRASLAGVPKDASGWPKGTHTWAQAPGAGAPPRSTPFEVDGKALAQATKPGAPLTPPKVVEAPTATPEPKGKVAKLRAVPGAVADAVKNIKMPEGFNLGSPAQVAAQRLATRGAGAVAVAPDVIKGLEVANAPGHTDIDALAQGSETVGKFGTAAAGAGMGAKLGAAAGAAFGGVGAIPGAAIGGVVGGGAGYLFGDGMIRSLRGAVDHFTNGTPWSAADTRSPHEKLVVNPTAPEPSQPAQASHSNEGRNHPTPVVVPEAPKTVRGADGRMYLEGARTDADFDRATKLYQESRRLRGAGEMGGDMNANAQRFTQGMAKNPAALSKLNEAYAADAIGVKASMQPNGNVSYGHSTEPTKMQYTDMNGAPTTDYTKTRQYAEGMQAREKLLADAAALDRRNAEREAAEADARERAAIPGVGMFGHNNATRAYENRVQLRQTAARDAAAAQHNQAQIGVQQEHNKVLREGQENQLRIATAPMEYAKYQRGVLAKLINEQDAAGGAKGGSPDYIAVRNRMLKAGLPVEEIDKVIASDNSAKAADQSLGDAQTKAMDSAFENHFNYTDAKGEPQRDKKVEAIAAKQFRTLTGGRNLSPTELQKHRNDAIDYAKAVQAFRAKTQLRNTGWQTGMPWGEVQPLPEAIPESGERGKVGWLRGTFTGHGLSKGDHTFGDEEMDASTDQGVLNYLDRVAETRKKLRN